ncbi:MAG: hypothetical protein WB439_14035 [Acidobacteriaceae bacterium]
MHYHCGIRGTAAHTMAPAQKKVVLRSFSNDIAWGYLPQSAFLRDNIVQLMAVDGRLTPFPIRHLKHIAYVKDFNLDDKLDPERIGRASFLARPRGDGVWLKLTFRDDNTLEGLSTLDLAFTDSLLDDRGFFLTPPDPRSNTQRLFIPRPALKSIDVLGFVTAPSRRPLPKLKRPATPDIQTKLFGE